MQRTKLDLGCGKLLDTDWISLDILIKIPPQDLQADATRLPFKSESFSEIFASHIVEHIDPAAGNFFHEWRRVLKTGGLLRVITPDILYSARSLEAGQIEEPWWNQIVFGERVNSAMQHKRAWTPGSLQRTLVEAGFECVVKDIAGWQIDIYATKLPRLIPD